MFTYDLYTKEVQGNLGLPGVQPALRDAMDVTEQSGDAVVMVLPYVDADTFNFVSQDSKDISIEESTDKSFTMVPQKSRPIKTGAPVFLDPYLVNLSVTHGKERHTGNMQIMMLDPEGDLLSRINPGDWVICWMFDNHRDGQALRAKLARNSFADLNSFSSGLKFVGKLFTTRRDLQVMPNGMKAKRITVMATSFSEMDSNIYYDPLLTPNFGRGGMQFMFSIANYLNRRTPLPEDIGTLMAFLAATFLGGHLSGSPYDESEQSRPLKIPGIVGQILGQPTAAHYIDILKTYIGIQQYTNKYVPDGLGDIGTLSTGDQTQPSPDPNIRFTPKALVGFANPMVSPYVNVPIWGILQQNLNPVANEMYTTLRVSEDGTIMPHLIIRQIPFNTDAFAKAYTDITCTPFRSLPRWKVRDAQVTDISVAKSESMRVNFVYITSVTSITPQQFAAFQRAVVDPTKDTTDIERNGLRAIIQGVNSTYGPTAIESAQKWTSLVADRSMGSHLKYSGQIGLAGVQEPIAVGDNLEYDGLLYHIESVQHSLTIAPQSGMKQFSTTLAISNGVPASGAVLPEIAIRETTDTQTTQQTPQFEVPYANIGKSKFVQTGLTGGVERFQQGQQVPTNFEPDKD